MKSNKLVEKYLETTNIGYKQFRRFTERVEEAALKIFGLLAWAFFGTLIFIFTFPLWVLGLWAERGIEDGND